MKKYYDKILFLLGLAVLGIGVGIFVYKGGVPQATPLPALKLSGAAFEAKSSPNMEEPSVDWETPPDQGEDRNEVGWTYSVFTPPKIWWEAGEGWTAVPPSGITTARPFGVRLVAAKKDLYRIQLQGTAGSGDAKDDIVFSDEETGYDFHLKVGDESTRHQIKVLDMTVDRQELAHGIVEKVAKVTLLDERTNQNVSLVQGQPLSPTNNEYYIMEVSAPYPEQEWKVSKVGDKLDLPNKGAFVVLALDFDKPSVTVEKHTLNKKGFEVTTNRVLTIIDDSAPAPAPQPSQPVKPAKPAAKAPSAAKAK